MTNGDIDEYDLDVLVMANNRNFLAWPENYDHSSALTRLKEQGLVEKTEFGSVVPSKAGYALLVNVTE